VCLRYLAGSCLLNSRTFNNDDDEDDDDDNDDNNNNNIKLGFRLTTPRVLYN